MKKLLTILAASAMFFAFGDNINNGMDFEAYTATGENSFPGNSAAYDPGTQSNYWYSTTYEGNVISNHVVAPALPTGVTRPEMFKDNTNTNFLYLETEAPLFRTVKTNTHSPSNFTGVSILENPIYLDTLVKFTAADSAFESLEDEADKIAIEYVEHESEGEGDEGFTNFVIRAGFIDNGSIVQTNYFSAVPENFNKDAWHRLTVRSLANIDGTGTGKGHVGFVVYLDQAPLKYATGVAVGDATFLGNLNADVQKNFYNSEIHALYPSAVDPEDLTGQKISAVAFSGNGSIDDVVFTTTKPTFIQESSVVTITWDAHLATLTLNDDPVDGFVPGTAGSASVEPQNGVVLVSATFAQGWEAGTFTTDGNGSWNSDTSSFIDLTSGETCNIVSMFPLYSVSVGGTTKKYDSLDAAITEAEKGTSGSPATLKLLADVSKSITIANAAFVIIDLNGKTITGDADSGATIVNGGATLTITNSSVTVGHVVPYDDNDSETDEFAVLLAAETVTYITAGSFDGAVGFDGFDADQGDVFVITGGKFLDAAAAGAPAAFYLKDYVAKDLAVTAEGSYFQIGESGGSGSEDWPDDTSTVSGQTAEAAFGITGDLANADAATLATWAKAKGVNYSDRTTGILTDAFLLNCANTQAAIDEAAADFKITAITVVGDTVTITPADGADYGNGQIAIEGATSLTSPISWHEKTTGDHFFRATLVVKPVAVP